MKFRNYVPHDKHLQEGKLAPAVLPKFEDPVATAPPPEKKEVLYLVVGCYHSIYSISMASLCVLYQHLCPFILILVKLAGSISEYCSKETKLGPPKRCAEEA